MLLSVLIFGLALSTSFAGFSKRNIPNPQPTPRASDVKPAVFVSPYLPDQADVARNLSQVFLPGWNQPNYAAFITIDKSTNSNHFFWFFESLDGNQNAPILVWLQGGPGVSSMFGLFTEIGPFNIDANMKISPRAVTWNQHYHLLFIDNPLGTGFSFTESASAFVTNETQVGANLYKVLLQFFQLFPNLKPNPFYITGESYAGKYVPAFGYTVHTQNQVAPPESKVNFKGIAIGDGALEPSQQFRGFGDLLYYIGMVNDNERKQFIEYEINMEVKLRQGDVVGAFQIFDEMLNGDFYPYPTYYANVTGMATNYFNFEEAPDAASITNNYFINWLNTPEARNAIHVGAYPFNVYNSSVEKHLQFDWMVGVVPFLVPLMENYKVLIYNGQNDVILGPPLTENFLRQLQWNGQQEYLNAPKKLWKIDLGAGQTDLAGYVRTVGNFAQVVVRGAGHMVPGDQPLRGYDLITRFVSGTL